MEIFGNIQKYALESLGIEISYGIIFIGNGELNIENFAKYIEKHKICNEYLKQSGAFLVNMRDKIENIQKSPQWVQYSKRYRTMVNAKKISQENFTKEIATYFQNSYEIMGLLRNTIIALRMNMNELIAD